MARNEIPEQDGIATTNAEVAIAGADHRFGI